MPSSISPPVVRVPMPTCAATYLQSRMGSDLDAAAVDSPFIPQSSQSLPSVAVGMATPPPTQSLSKSQVTLPGPATNTCPSPQSSCSGTSNLDDASLHVTASTSRAQDVFNTSEQEFADLIKTVGYSSVNEVYGELEKELSTAATTAPTSDMMSSIMTMTQTTMALEVGADRVRQRMDTVSLPTAFTTAERAASTSGDLSSILSSAASHHEPHHDTILTPLSSPELSRAHSLPGMQPGMQHHSISRKHNMPPHPAVANAWAPFPSLTDSHRSTKNFIQQQQQQQLMQQQQHQRRLQSLQQPATQPLYSLQRRPYDSLPEHLGDVFSPTDMSPGHLDDSVFGSGFPSPTIMSNRGASYARAQQFMPPYSALGTMSLRGGDQAVYQACASMRSLPGLAMSSSMPTIHSEDWGSPVESHSSSDGGQDSDRDSLAVLFPSSPCDGRTKKPSRASRTKPRRNAIKHAILRRQIVSKQYTGQVPPASLQLWEFLLHHLERGTAQDAIAWIDDRSGKFRIVNSEKIAKMWGDYRSVPAMDYEKMTRALRYYYRRRILEKLQRRLIYQFSTEIMQQVTSYRTPTTTE
eukprot:scpid41532/ scgid27877/ ETS-related transcription factor Elf-4; E74-like factor 4; Myeloid Elf-1-like factor